MLKLGSRPLERSLLFTFYVSLRSSSADSSIHFNFGVPFWISIEGIQPPAMECN